MITLRSLSIPFLAISLDYRLLVVSQIDPLKIDAPWPRRCFITSTVKGRKTRRFTAPVKAITLIGSRECQRANSETKPAGPFDRPINVFPGYVRARTPGKTVWRPK